MVDPDGGHLVSPATTCLILLPIGTAAVLACLAGRRLAAEIVAGVSLCAHVILVVALYLTYAAPRSALEASWLPALGSQILLAVDGISIHAILVLTAVFVVAVIAEIRLQAEGASVPRLALIFVVVAAMDLFLLSHDVLSAAAAHGTAGLALAALLGIGTDLAGRSAARRFASWAVAGTILLSTSAAILSAVAGSTVIDDLTHIDPGAARFAASLLALAMAMQLPLIPLHTWLAPVAAAGSLAGRTLVFGAWCAAGVIGLLRYGLGLFPDLLAYAAPVPLYWGTATLAYAALLAVAQREQDLPRRLSWVTLGAGGLLLVGVAGLETSVVLGAWLYASAQALPRVALLLLAQWITHTGARRGTLAAIWATLALVLVAAPGASLFPGWLLVVTGTASPVVAGILMLATVTMAFALLVPTVRLARVRTGPGLPVALSRLLVAVLAVVLLTGWFPGSFVDRTRPDVEGLLERVPPTATAAQVTEEAP